MKYLYIGLALMVGMLASSLLCLWQVCRSTEEITIALNQAVEACDQENLPRAMERAEQAERLWQSRSGFLCSLLDHAETDEIQWGFSDIHSYASVDDIGEVRVHCAKVRSMVQHLKEMELPYYFNLL